VFNLIPIALCVSALLAVWVATLVQRRPSARGAAPFFWLVVGVGWWCAAGAGHALADTVEVKIWWAKAQYLGIAAVPVCWLEFTAEYAGAAWFKARGILLALSVIPVVTVFAAATNELHHAMWPSVTMQANGLTVYEHGWWFWIAAGFNYIVVLVGTLLVARALRRGRHG